MALTCRSDDLDKVIEKDTASNDQNEIDEPEKDDFFQQYLQKKLEEMNKKFFSL